MGEFWAPGPEIWLFKKKNMDRSIDLAVWHKHESYHCDITIIPSPMVEMVIHHLHGYQHPNPCHSHQPVAIWGSWLLIVLYLLQITWKRNKTNTLWANVTTRLSKTFTLLNSSNSSSDQFTPFSTLPLLAPHLFPCLPKWPILLSTLTAPPHSPQYSTIMHRMLDDTSQSSTVFQNTPWWSTNQPCQSWLSNRQGRHTLRTIHRAHLIWIMMIYI